MAQTVSAAVRAPADDWDYCTPLWIAMGMRRRPNWLSKRPKRPAICVWQDGQHPAGVTRYFNILCQSRTISALRHSGQ
jgi:hypothetical protein